MASTTTSTLASHAEAVHDVTARKFHQAVCVIALAAAFVVGRPVGEWVVLAIGLILAVGRFWWPADVFRQLVWRVLEPAGILSRHERVEDHETRRIARVLGGAILIVAAFVLAVGQPLAWILVGLIGIMVALDAVFNFCALCAATYWFARVRSNA
jgi:hypothetical protein